MKKRYVVELELIYEDGSEHKEILEFVTDTFEKTLEQFARGKPVLGYKILEARDVIGKTLLLG